MKTNKRHGLVSLLAPFWWQIILLFIGLVLQVNASLQLPDIMANIIDQGISTGDMNYVWSQGFVMLGITLLGGAGMVLAGFFAARIGTGFAKRVRAELFKTIMSFSVREIDQFSTASLITRTTNDINQLQQTLVMVLRMSCQAPIMAVGAIAMAINTAPSMTWIIGLVVAILLALVIVVVKFGLPKFQIIQKLNDKLNLVTRENLTGLRVVRAFNNEAYEEQKFETANDDVTRVNTFTQRLMVIMMPTVQLAMSGSVLLIIWIGVHLVDSGSIEIGSIMAFIQYSMQVMMSFMFLTMAFIIVPRAIISWRRIKEVLHANPSITWPNKSADASPKQFSGIEFNKVSFAYSDSSEPVIKDVSFKAARGQTTAIIGATGSGKSTIVSLLPRLYDPTAGTIKIDGLDIKSYDELDLNSKIGLIPQRAVLFSGTIESNIKLGAPKITQKQVEKAAKIADAADFIAKLDKKYKAPVAEGGTNFSGGQKQRLSIARAVAKSPEIYIFDDSFSALDYKTDLKVRTNLKDVTANAVVLIVAQRVGTIKHADQILVVDEGKIVGTGTHYELLNTCPVYREIAASQLSEQEMKQELSHATKK